MNEQLSPERLLILALACVLGACARPSSNTKPVAEEPSVQAYDLGMRYAREFRLKDGTRCVAIMDTGITCDWNRYVGVER